MNRIINLLILSSIISISSGCASLGLGEEEYACKGYPGHPNCMSARDVYKATNYRDSLYEEEPSHDLDHNENELVTAEYDEYDDDDEYDDFPVDTPTQTYQQKIDRFRSTPSLKSNVKGVKASIRSTDNVVASNGPVVPRMKGAMPVRTNAQVMRIWVAPWEDKEGDLHAPGIVYKEIAGRRWNFGEAQYRASRYMSPLTTGYRKPVVTAGE